MLVKEKETGEIWALKALRKDQLIDQEQIEHTKTERDILMKAKNHPFLVGMKYCFQDDEKVFFVMEFMKGGELFQHLREKRRFSEKRCKFYIACMALGIGFLHKNQIAYRDLKPENVLMDADGYVCLADFGIAK